MSENKYPIGGYAPLPADDAVQNWFEENIDKECSASSAIYKFRLWLESLQPKPQPPVWVKDALKWSKEAIEFANKEFECPQPLIETWGNLYMNVLHAIDQALDEAQTTNNEQITAALQKFVSMHETGLLPNRFTYEEGKKALEGIEDAPTPKRKTWAERLEEEKAKQAPHPKYYGPNSHCKACEDEANGIKHLQAQIHTCRKRRKS